MISINAIQEALVIYLKAKATITAVIPAVEIREDQWNGTAFTYPNIRIAMQVNTPMVEVNCLGNIFNASIEVYSETSNSKQADDDAAIVATELHRQAFSQGTLKFAGVNVIQLIPAIYDLSKKAWVAKVLIRGTVN